MFNNKRVLILTVFFLGLLFVILNKPKSCLEFFSNNLSECPDILIQKENHIFLYNSKLAQIPGINPVKFSNLEEYVEFTKWQRSQGIKCPILFLQHSYDAQGNAVYKKRPSPMDLQGGLHPTSILDDNFTPQSKLVDATRNDLPYNKNSFPGFDPENQYVGLDTPIDKMFNSNGGVASANPMDSNWVRDSAPLKP